MASHVILSSFLQEGTFPERKALIRNFVKGIEVWGRSLYSPAHRCMARKRWCEATLTIRESSSGRSTEDGRGVSGGAKPKSTERLALGLLQ